MQPVTVRRSAADVLRRDVVVEVCAARPAAANKAIAPVVIHPNMRIMCLLLRSLCSVASTCNAGSRRRETPRGGIVLMSTTVDDGSAGVRTSDSAGACLRRGLGGRVLRAVVRPLQASSVLVAGSAAETV